AQEVVLVLPRETRVLFKHAANLIDQFECRPPRFVDVDALADLPLRSADGNLILVAADVNIDVRRPLVIGDHARPFARLDEQPAFTSQFGEDLPADEIEAPRPGFGL